MSQPTLFDRDLSPGDRVLFREFGASWATATTGTILEAVRPAPIRQVPDRPDRVGQFGRCSKPREVEGFRRAV